MGYLKQNDYDAIHLYYYLNRNYYRRNYTFIKAWFFLLFIFILVNSSRMVITLCYDAISRNVEGLGISPFIMFSLSATAIFPACLVILLLQDRIGRKAMASSSLFISGIFTAGTGIIIAYQQGVQGKK